MYYGGLHARINHLYNCNCDDCKNNAGHIHLAAGDKLFKDVLTAAKGALKHLFSVGKYSPEDLKQKEYKKLIDETYKVFEKAISDNDIPGRMRQALESDAFLFGGLKAHAQLSEAFSMIKDGKVKSWSEIEHEFDKLNDTYNRNWLQAEYNFALNAAQQAANWANTDPDGRYNLQYRTALDEKVREEHQALEGITLPKENEFWDKFYPPNGWNCRCTVVEVRKSKYTESDAEEAMRKGEAATSQIGKDGKNRLEIFRFNPGKEEKLFPPEHPYRKVKGAGQAKNSIEEIEQKNDYDILHQSDYFKHNLTHLPDDIRNAYPEIDVEKINSVNMYSNHYFMDINSFNRGLIDKVEIIPEHGMTEEFYRKLTKTINTALDEIPNKFQGMTYRGTDLTAKQVEKYRNAFNAKEAIMEAAFTSTSYDEGEAFDGNVKFFIQSKSGTKIEKISNSKNEKEVLFKAGQEFKVTDFKEYDGNVYDIYLEEI